MKKILVISHVRLAANGVVTVLKNYYSRLNREEFCVDFLFPSVTDEKGLEFFESIGNVYTKKRSMKRLPQYMYYIYKLIKKNKYDIVHIHGNSATMVFGLLPAFFAGVKERYVHSHNTVCSAKTMHNVLNPLFKKLYTGCFACGEKAGEWIFGKGNFKIINNGIDLDKYSFSGAVRNKIRQEEGLEDKIVIGHIGLFNRQKNHKFLLEVFESLYEQNKSFHLILIGDGQDYDAIYAIAKERGLLEGITIKGLIQNAHEYYHAFDVFVLPSLFEGLPLVAVEAQASGVPVLLSDKVSEEAKLSTLAEFLPLEKQVWVSRLKEFADEYELQTAENTRKKGSEKARESLCENGFDINKNIEVLEEFYLN